MPSNFVISGIAKLDTSSGARVGMVSMVFVLVTLVVSITIGILLMVIITPVSQLRSDRGQVEEYSSYTDIFLDLLRLTISCRHT